LSSSPRAPASSFSLWPPDPLLLMASILSGLDQLALDLVDFGRNAVDLYPQLRRRSSMRSMAYREERSVIYLGQGRRLYQRRVLDLHCVMQFIALFQPAQYAMVSSTLGSRPRPVESGAPAPHPSRYTCDTRPVWSPDRSSSLASLGFIIFDASTAPCAEPAPRSCEAHR